MNQSQIDLISTNYFDEIKNIGIDNYFKNNQFAKTAFIDKYTISDQEKQFPAYTFKRVCDAISSMEKTKELQEYWSNLWLYQIWNDWWKPGGSIIQGAGNSRFISLSNCTTIDIEEDSIESIFETGKKIAKSAAFRQGLGVDISILRPRGASVNNAAKISTGSIEWMKWFDNIGSHVGQKGRVPAMLFSINIKHPDVLEFIKAKSNLHAVQNANISIQITDDFMKAYEEDKNWELIFNTKKETLKQTIKAKELMKLLSTEANNFAEPGVQFIDTAQKESVTNSLGFPVKSTNACSEKFMYQNSTCVLASINVGKFSSTKYKESLENISKSITRFLDNVVEYELINNRTPYPEQATVISNLREIGCGIVNLHGWLFNQGLSYDEDKAIKKAEDFIKYYSYYCWKSSIDLGKEKGNCVAFDENKISKNVYINRLQEEFEDLQFNYLRNSQVMSIAPTGTLSLMFSEPVISSGIEPTIGFYFWKRARTSGKYIWYFVVPEFVRNNLKDKGITLPFEGESIEDNSGEIGEQCKKIIDKYYDPALFKPAHKIDPLRKIELMGKFSKWIDSSISVTYNLPEDSTSDLVEKIYYQAWKKGIKSVSVYRDKSREGIIEFDSPKIVAKRFLKKEELKEPILNRPQYLKANINHVKVSGKKFIVVVGFMNEKPYEVFAGEQETIEIPSKIKYGLVEKAGSRKYHLYLSEKEVEATEPNEDFFKIKDIIKQFNNDSYSDLTRLLSTTLRYNVPLSIVTDQLDKTESDITSFGKAISRVLKQYIGEQTTTEFCPVCKDVGLLSESGCLKCINCGYTKCT